MIGRWEIYEAGENKPFKERVHVTLNRKSVFCLNTKVFEMLGKPEAVVLMFDKKEKVIGMRSARISSTGTFRVHRHTARETHKVIRPAPFCRAFNIRMDCTSAFMHPRVDDDGVLLLDLKATVPARARRAPRKLTGREWTA